MGTRGSRGRALATLAAGSAALAVVGIHTADAACTMDVECEGERICEQGLCVDPRPEAASDRQSARAPAEPATVSSAPVAAPQESVIEVGGFGFEIYDADATTFGGGVQAGYRLSPWLGMGAWLEATGKREQTIENGSATYRRDDLGVGPTVGLAGQVVFGDASVLVKLTRLTLQGTHLVRGFVTEPTVTRWGIAADARVRLGFVLGHWRLFMLVAGSYASTAESLMLYFPDRGVTVGRGNVSLGGGLSYCFGGRGR